MQYKLIGPLGMDTCGEQAKTLLAILRQPAPLELDFTEVSTVDSAALALILELRREAIIQKQTLSIRGLPDELASLAELYGIDVLLAPIEKVEP
jgi:phospholipid transport system transporter-binding protein